MITLAECYEFLHYPVTRLRLRIWRKRLVLGAHVFDCGLLAPIRKDSVVAVKYDRSIYQCGRLFLWLLFLDMSFVGRMGGKAAVKMLLFMYMEI